MLKLSKKLLRLAPLVVLVALCNYGVDPAHLFQAGRYERKIAGILATGKNVAGLSNFDERLVQRFYVESLAQPKDTVVIGSSRCLQIGADAAGHGTFFNSAVSGAVIQDDMAIYEMYREKGMLPKMVILGLDPWLLNQNNGETRWQSVADYYERAAGIVSSSQTSRRSWRIGASQLDKYCQLVSPVYFQESLRSIFRGAPTHGRCYATNDASVHVAAKMADGRYVYPRQYREKAPETVRREAVEYASGQVYSLGNFDRINGVRRLEGFIREMQRDGVRVRLFLPPYNPVTYRLLVANPRYRIIREVEARYRDLARRTNVPLVGSFDPAAAGLGEEDFFDGMHPKPSGIRKILGRYS